MGLNLNYTLLKEGSNSYFKIPEYKQMDPKYNIYSDGYMIQKLSQFNQITRESMIELSNINFNYMTESSASIDIINNIKDIINKIVESIKVILNTLVNSLTELLRKIKDNSIEDKIDQKYRQTERIRILRQALYNVPSEETIISISNINPSSSLLSRNFPDTSIIGTELTKSINRAIDNYISKINYSTSNIKKDDPTFIGSEGFINYIEQEKDNILIKMFNRYQYDSTNITQSSIITANKAFGSPTRQSTKLTVDLYLLACDNLTREKEVINNVEKEIQSIKSNYNSIISTIEKIESKIHRIIIDISKETDYITASNKLISDINRIFNLTNQVINVNYNLLRLKKYRINEIFDPINGDSIRIKRLANRLIIRQSNSITESYYDNFSDDVYNARILEEQFESMLALAEEYWIESEYNSSIMMYLTEEEVAKTIGNTSTNVAGAPHFIDVFNSTFDKFRQVVMEGVTNIMDTKFWNRNRGKIKDINLTSTTIADWKTYDLDKFARRLNTVKYDDNAEYLNTDELMQNAIFKALDITPSTDENKSFSKKVSEGFYTSYIPKDKPTLISSSNFRKDQTFNFVDEIIRNGFNGQVFGNIKEDRKFINDTFKNAKQNSQKTADKISDDKNDINNKISQASSVSVAKATGAPASETGNTSQTIVDQNSALLDSDFRFNLAEHFGLVTSNKIINLNEAPIVNVGEKDREANQGISANNGVKEANARLNRYFKFMTFALSAKMTATWSAYKQYIGFYKLLFNAPKNDNNQTTDQPTNQQPQQSQN